jgi:CHAT domain-containing protein
MWRALLLAFLLFAAADDPTQLLSKAQQALASGHYSEAVEKGKKAAELFRQTGDRTQQGRALTTAGLAEMYLGDYPAALATLNQALELARQTGDVEREITRLSDVGIIYYYLGRYGDALLQYQEGLRRVQAFPNEKWSASRRQLVVANIAIVYQTLGQYDRSLDLYSDLLKTPQALPPVEQAQVLTNIGVLRRRLGDPQKALQTYREAQAIYQRAAYRDGEIAVLNNIGIVQAMDLADFPSALATFNAGLQMAEASNDRPLMVHAHLYRGEMFYRAGDLQNSAADFHAAADEAAALTEPEEEWKAVFGLARIADKRGDHALADQLLNRAINLIESLRADTGGSSLASEFLADKRDVYDLLIEHTTEPQQLFRLMEHSRARVLQSRVRDFRELPAIVRSVPEGTAVLEYWVGRSSVLALWIAHGETGVRRSALTTEELEQWTAFSQSLSQPQDASWRTPAAAIADKLIQGLSVLQDPRIHHLVIVPDGILSQIPFDVFPLNDSTLMVERFAISYLPAASLLESSSRTAVRWPWQRTLEVFADPSSGTGGSAGEASPRAWPPLPEARHEAQAIAAIVGGARRVHIGPEARKIFLHTDAIPPLLHFASHAFADSRKPDLSFILLAPASASQRFDYLFLREVSALPLREVEMVTVSACQTDAGKLVRGEGVESFSWAFLSAGAHSIVSSLWSVSDRATAALMIRFYQQLRARNSKTEALQQAKLELLRNPATQHPAYWAGFVLNGEAESEIPYVLSWGWFAAAVALLLAVGLLVYRIRVKRA